MLAYSQDTEKVSWFLDFNVCQSHMVTIELKRRDRYKVLAKLFYVTKENMGKIPAWHMLTVFLMTFLLIRRVIYDLEHRTFFKSSSGPSDLISCM